MSRHLGFYDATKEIDLSPANPIVLPSDEMLLGMSSLKWVSVKYRECMHRQSYIVSLFAVLCGFGVAVITIIHQHIRE